VRPLFVHEAGTTLRFAGEVRELLRLLPGRPAPDELGIAHWLALGSRPDDGTLYAGVRRLGPGEVLGFDAGGARRRRYWQPRFREPISASDRELGELLRAELERSISRRLDPAGGTGLLLSGGLDSASIAGLGGDRLLACSGVFPEHPWADETELLEQLRGELGLRGLVAEVRPGGLLAAAVEHLAAWRMPLLGWGDFWTLPLMRAAREQGVGTMLGGDGGDEVFGPRAYALADALRAGRPGEVLELARRLPGRTHASGSDEARMVARLALGGAMPYLGPSRLRLPRARRRLSPWLSRRTVAAVAASEDPVAWKGLDGPRWWAHAAYGIARGIEQTGVFEHQRRRARLAQLEARHPMLDLDLVELALRQPPAATLDPRFSRPLLRSALAGVLPDSVRLWPQKALFESLIVSCLSGSDGAAVRRLLTAPDAEIGAFVDVTKMREELFSSDLAQRQPFAWMWQVWRLLNLELWLRSQGSQFGFPEPFPALSGTRIAIAPEARLLPFSTLTGDP
jgi:asparagine synthase (glutamine-hydrolysing)